MRRKLDALKRLEPLLVREAHGALLFPLCFEQEETGSFGVWREVWQQWSMGSEQKRPILSERCNTKRPSPIVTILIQF